MSDKAVKDNLLDLIDLGYELAEYLSGLDVQDYLDDREKQRSVERVVELIGEVAVRLGDDAPEIGIPWRKVRDMRIILAHRYEKIDPQIVFRVATHEIPELVKRIEEFLAA